MRHVLSPTNRYTQNTQTYRNIYIGGCVSNAYIYIYKRTHTWYKDKHTRKLMHQQLTGNH